MKKRHSQPKRRRIRKRKINRFRLFVVLSIVNVFLLIGSLLLLPTALRNYYTAAGKPSTLGVRSITVEGNSHYDNEAIIGVSGVTIGQNVFSVSKGQAAKRLTQQFAYVREAQISISFKRDVIIRITEAEEMGAVYANGGWVVVDEKGIGLQKLPIESERPLRRMYLKGAGALTDQIGQQVLDARSLAIITEIRQAFETYELGDVSEIDLTNLTDIRVNWKNQIDIALGNNSNLTYEIAVAAASLPKILARHGQNATGLLNVSQYSDSSIDMPSIIFTPSALLDSGKTSTTDDKS